MSAAADPVAAVLDAWRERRSLLLRTSATTGGGRSVIRTAESWVASFPAVAALSGTGPDSRVWVPGPLSATMNLFAAALVGWRGARTVTDPAEATHAHLTPWLLSRHAGELRPGTHVTVAGDRLSPAAAEAACRSGLRVAHYYGAAELSFVAWGGHAEDLRPFPGVEVEAREGLLWARSAYLALGYAEDGDGPLRRAADGFATVGDRGRLHGCRVVVDGRDADAVTTAGATVVVGDVEAHLRRVARGEVVVVGRPHPDWGQVLVAVHTVAADGAALRAAARDLPPAARPRRWEQRADLPLTPAGKLDRVALARSPEHRR